MTSEGERPGSQFCYVFMLNLKSEALDAPDEKVKTGSLPSGEIGLL